ncbi:MAG TPA: biotin synthase BioB [Phycisphaerae bacterium]|nr:biotin synthase BioB [Phycisphaerae bacterium]
MNPQIAEIAQTLLAGGRIERPQAEVLTRATGTDVYDLLYWANRIRVERCGEAVSFCSIAALTVGGCTEDCAFCAQSARHRVDARRRQVLDDDEVLSAAEQAVKNGAESFGLVTSGCRPTRSLIERVTALADKLRRRVGIHLCAALGTIDGEQARTLRQAGIERYNHNLETSARFFPSIVTTHTYADRLQTVAAVAGAGLSICSGGIFGVGENWADRLDMAFALRDCRPDVVPLNFLHPIAGTPLAQAAPLPPMEILQIIAVFRFIFPSARIKVAGGREANLRDLQSWMFFAGASSALIGNYLTTAGRPADEDQQMLRDLGLMVERSHTP